MSCLAFSRSLCLVFVLAPLVSSELPQVFPQGIWSEGDGIRQLSGFLDSRYFKNLNRHDSVYRATGQQRDGDEDIGGDEMEDVVDREAGRARSSLPEEGHLDYGVDYNVDYSVDKSLDEDKECKEYYNSKSVKSRRKKSKSGKKEESSSRKASRLTKNRNIDSMDNPEKILYSTSRDYGYSGVSSNGGKRHLRHGSYERHGAYGNNSSDGDSKSDRKSGGNSKSGKEDVSFKKCGESKFSNSNSGKSNRNSKSIKKEGKSSTDISFKSEKSSKSYGSSGNSKRGKKSYKASGSYKRGRTDFQQSKEVKAYKRPREKVTKSYNGYDSGKYRFGSGRGLGSGRSSGGGGGASPAPPKGEDPKVEDQDPEKRQGRARRTTVRGA